MRESSGTEDRDRKTEKIVERIEKLEEENRKLRQKLGGREKSSQTDSLSRRSFMKKLGVGTLGLSALSLMPAAAKIKISDLGITKDSDSFWNAGNDGSGSGLNADTVDGQDAADLGAPSSTQSAGGSRTWVTPVVNAVSSSGDTDGNTSPVDGDTSTHMTLDGDSQSGSWVEVSCPYPCTRVRLYFNNTNSTNSSVKITTENGGITLASQSGGLTTGWTEFNLSREVCRIRIRETSGYGVDIGEIEMYAKKLESHSHSI
jgi:hypothetical protein